MPNAIYNDAKKRRPNQKARILQKLQEAGEHGVLNSELQKISLRFTSIISNMHMEGYEIAVENLGDGVCNYYLISIPQTEKPEPPKAVDLLISEIKKTHGDKITAADLVGIMSQFNFTMMKKKRNSKEAV